MASRVVSLITKITAVIVASTAPLFAYAPNRWTPVLFIAFTIFWVLLYRASTLKEALGVTFLFAIGYFSFADTWLLKIPESHAFSLFLFTLTVAVATALYLLIATLLHLAKRQNPVYFFLLAPLLFAATDAEFALLSGGGTHGLAYLPPMR